MPVRPTLSLGMATYNDFSGVYFTCQAARLYHDVVAEVLVVDNNPASPDGEATRRFCEFAKVRYVPYTARTGTAAPRDEVFQQATGDVVVCCDPHVLFPAGSLASLVEYFRARPDSKDLVQGPLVYDALDGNVSTHFDLTKWDGEMWGQWGVDVRGRGTEPFEIPAQGLGAFACRRDAWLGFHPGFRGFGGEEGYIHEKYRLAGHRALCLPAFTWVHRFGRPAGVPYPLARQDKVRNYVIGFQELGLDLTPAKDYWVGKGLVPEEQWDHVVKTGEFPGTPAGAAAPAKVGCSACSGKPLRAQPPDGYSLESLFSWVKGQPRDLDQHADRIRYWAGQSNTPRSNSIEANGRITAFVKRREWNVLLAAGMPASLTVYQDEGDPLLDQVHAAVLAHNKEEGAGGRGLLTYTTHVAGPGADSLSVDIAETDLLVIDTVHHADRLYAELTRHAPRVTGRILLRGTGAFGERAEDGQGPGLLPAVRKFISENPEWTVVEHTKDQYGLTVLSKLPVDKKPLPSLWRQGVNAAKAAWRNGANVVGNDGPLKDTEKQDTRLALCLLCPSHNDGKCGECGCPVDRKTTWPGEFCPLGKWGPEEVPSAG